MKAGHAALPFMPPNTNATVTPEVATKLVQWILSLKVIWR